MAIDCNSVLDGGFNNETGLPLFQQKRLIGYN